MLAFEIVARAESGWPYNAVPYSQTTVWSDGYRQDCSGFASMAAGLPAPGLSTVTFLTTGTVRLIGWSELAAGDFVGALGPGTEGDAGHIMVVESTDHAAGTYTVLEQAGYGPGPDRNTYAIGDGQGRNYLPYRLSNLEEAMSISKAEQADLALYPLIGSDTAGYPAPNGVNPKVAQALADHNLAAVEARLAKQIGDGFAALGQLLAGAGATADLPAFLAAVQAAAERGAVQALDGATIHVEAAQ